MLAQEMREISDKAWEGLREDTMNRIYDLIIVAADRGDSALTICKNSKNLKYICDELKREGFEASVPEGLNGFSSTSIRVSWKETMECKKEEFDAALASQMHLRTEMAKNDEYKKQKERQIQKVKEMASKGERVARIVEGSPECGHIDSKYKTALKDFFEREGFGIRDITEYSFAVEW